MKKENIFFVWQGITKRKDHWRDGLWGAMQILEKTFNVKYFEPWDDIPNDGVVMYWEAPCTVNGENAKFYNRVHELPNKKILLFAGGPLRREWVDHFDIVAVESAINARECEEMDIPHITAFGVNTDNFKPMKTKKEYDTVTHGTCASWKRQWLVCQAMGEKALVFGQTQESDPAPFDLCKKCNSSVLPEVDYKETCRLLNSAYVSVNCADFWGGGQRATLEAMACDIPVICMADSPKNMEFIEEAGFGKIVEPVPLFIAEAVEELKGKKGGRDYVMSKWTHKHYAESLLEAINKLVL